MTTKGRLNSSITMMKFLAGLLALAAAVAGSTAAVAAAWHEAEIRTR